jgi:hypothetical protein
MYSRLFEMIKTEDPDIRYKDCDLFVKHSSVKKTPAKTDKGTPLTLRILKTTWGEINLN